MSQRQRGLGNGPGPKQDEDVGSWVVIISIIQVTLHIPIVSAKNSLTQELRILKLQPDRFFAMICVKYLSLVTDCCSYFVAVLARAQWPGWDAGAWPQLGPAASRGGSDTAKADWASGLSPGPIPASDTRKTRGQSNIRIPKGWSRQEIKYSIFNIDGDERLYDILIYTYFKIKSPQFQTSNTTSDHQDESWFCQQHPRRDSIKDQGQEDVTIVGPSWDVTWHSVTTVTRRDAQMLRCHNTKITQTDTSRAGGALLINTHTASQERK